MAFPPKSIEATATLVVNKSLNLSKQALQSDAEINGEIQWRIAFTNTNSLDYTNYKMLDVMPYNGDANGSSFDGSYTITATLTAPSEIKLYSSTDKMYVEPTFQPWMKHCSKNLYQHKHWQIKCV